MNRNFLKIALPLLMLASTPSYASFVSTDVNTERDSLATLDRDTGIEWLDFTVTKGVSFNDVNSLIAKGGELEGWRLPTKVEVSTMLYNYFNSTYSFIQNEGNVGTDDYFSISSSANTSVTNSFIFTFGFSATNIYSNTKSIRAEIRYLNDDGAVEKFYAYQSNYTSSASKRRVINVTLKTSYVGNVYDYSSSYVGIFLVSDGGVTMSSLQDPSLNAINPNSPYNVPVFGGLGFLAFSAFSLVSRKKIAI